jgi:SEC-C motif-containing protein
MDTKQMCPCGATEVTAKRSGSRGELLAGGVGKRYTDCCGRYIDLDELAPTAEALMRSRYTAYTLGREDYLLATWYHGTRPASLEPERDPHRKWLRLEVRRHEQPEPEHAVVEFVARYKVGGRAHRLHEINRFVREAGQWFYVNGDIA